MQAVRHIDAKIVVVMVTPVIGISSEGRTPLHWDGHYDSQTL